MKTKGVSKLVAVSCHKTLHLGADVIAFPHLGLHEQPSLVAAIVKKKTQKIPLHQPAHCRENKRCGNWLQ
jgi:hypothetical protein